MKECHYLVPFHQQECNLAVFRSTLPTSQDQRVGILDMSGQHRRIYMHTETYFGYRKTSYQKFLLSQSVLQQERDRRLHVGCLKCISGRLQ